jgi:hypothetical protein
MTEAVMVFNPKKPASGAPSSEAVEERVTNL